MEAEEKEDLSSKQPDSSLMMDSVNRGQLKNNSIPGLWSKGVDNAKCMLKSINKRPDARIVFNLYGDEEWNFGKRVFSKEGGQGRNFHYWYEHQGEPIN